MLSVHWSVNLCYLRGDGVLLGFLSGTGTGVVALEGMGVRAGVRRNGVFATGSDSVGRAGETAVCSRSWLTTNAGGGVVQCLVVGEAGVSVGCVGDGSIDPVSGIGDIR